MMKVLIDNDYTDINYYFIGFDSGELSTVGAVNTFTISNLTPGRRYFIRVLARNSQGSGEYCAFTEANCLIVVNQASAIARPLAA
jgi:hypothetical protein